MTKDEALQICLEYIETDAHERRHVRWAIKEALAKQEGQSNFCPQCEALASELKAIKQEQGEPVARVHTFVGSEWAVVQVLGEFNLEDEFCTTPQQRTWVGLTDEETNVLWMEGESNINFENFSVVAYEIEAKLRSKNA